MKIMKIMIVGAGVIGTITGWSLSNAGHEVIHLVRPDKISKIQGGISMDVLDKRKWHNGKYIGRYLLRLTESISPSNRFDLVIVPVKHYQLIDVLQQIIPQLGTVNYLLLTQNWNGSTEIDTLLPQSQYLFGDIKAGGGFREGKLISTIKAIDLGQVNGRQDECLNRSVQLFQSADLNITVQKNILHYLWVQYAIIGGLGPILVRAGGFKSALSDRKLLDLGLSSAEECLEVVSRRGVDLNQYPDAKMYMKPSWITRRSAGIILRYMFAYNEYVRRNSLHALSDPKEVKTFYFDLVRTGQELGVDMPFMNRFRQDINDFITSK
jgi:2-dehydropantoate 2-reductase